MGISFKAIIGLLKQYGEVLFTHCPSSCELVLYAEQADELTGEVRKRIRIHLTVCLVCREKVGWCQDHDEQDTLP